MAAPSPAGPSTRDLQRKFGRAQPLTHGDVLAVSLPIIFSNLTTPLIGLADTAVVGRLDRPELIGAVAIGATVFTILYWGFAFLRMGTTGLTAQADGAGDSAGLLCVLARALLIALGSGLALIVLQRPLIAAALWALGGSDAVREGADEYFGMRIWGAPAALVNFVVFGWLVGLRRTRTAFAVQLLLNGLNILLAVVLGLWLGLSIRGVGLAAALADVTAAVVGLALVAAHARRAATWPDWRAILETAGVRRTLAMNGDIILRTLCVQMAFSFFTAQMAGRGDVMLAANAILMQFVTAAAYLLDGFAYAAEALVGRAVGARDRARFEQAIAITTLWAGVCGVLAGALILLAGGLMIDALTVSAAVRAEARAHLGWAALGPVVGFACYQLDGIFIGATRTRDMRNMMLISLVVFLALAATLPAWLGTTGLWLALIAFYVARAVTLRRRLPALRAALFSGPRQALKGR